jgi:ketosteroid isomerase-like protein
MAETARTTTPGESARQSADANARHQGSTKAQRFIGALYRLENDGDVDTIAGLYGDAAEVSNPTDTKPHRGRDGAREFWSKYRESFEHVHSEFRNVVESDDTALLEWRSDGRTAAGEDFSYDGVSVIEFDGDSIRRFRAYFDPHALSAAGTTKTAAQELTPTNGGT